MKARGCELDHVPVIEVLSVKISQSESGHGRRKWGGCSRHTHIHTSAHKPIVVRRTSISSVVRSLLK